MQPCCLPSTIALLGKESGLSAHIERFNNMQVLAGLTNQQIVLDPDGHLQPGEVVKLPFSLNETDSGADIIMLSPAPLVLRPALETPSGEMLTPGALPAGIKYVAGAGVAYFRFSLPLVTGGGRPAWAGRWVLHLECDPADFRRYLNTLENNPKLYEYTKSHGLRWSMVVQARSSLMFDARLHQSEVELGASMQLIARLAEYGLPVEGRAEIAAELVTPSGAAVSLPLKESAGGVFEAEVKGTEYGLYRYRVVAAGKTLRGSRFTRERTLTGSIYVARPPVDPEPPKEDGQCGKRLVALLEIITGASAQPRLYAGVGQSGTGGHQLYLADCLNGGRGVSESVDRV